MDEGEARVGAGCESARNGAGPSAQPGDHQLSERKAVAAGRPQEEDQAWGEGLQHLTEADAAAAETGGIRDFFFGVLVFKNKKLLLKIFYWIAEDSK